MNNWISCCLLSSLLVLLASCGEENSPESRSYDRRQLLTDWSEQYILPTHEQFKNEAAALKTAIDQLDANQDTSALNTAREQFVKTWKSFQEVSFLDFGPNAEIGLNDLVNIFPTDTVQIKANIASSSYVLFAANNNDARGFPAIDYLLYGTGNTKEEVVAYFQNSTEARDYLKVLSNSIDSLAKKADADWEAYKETFIAKDGVDINSSLGNVLNGFNNYLERRHRSARFRDPGGGTAGLAPNPNAIESRFGNHSLSLALTCQNAMRLFWNNKDNFMGFDDVLNTLGTKDDQGNPLSETIDAQFVTAAAAINTCQTEDGTLQSAIQTNSENVKTIYSELQRLVLFTKIDVSSELGIQITYADNDGD